MANSDYVNTLYISIGYWYRPISAALCRLSEYRLNLVSVHSVLWRLLCCCENRCQQDDDRQLQIGR